MGGRIFHQTHWAPLLKMQGSVAEVKLEFVHRGGHAIPMMMNAIIAEHGGTFFHQLAVFVATDRHKYERELLGARKRAEQLLQQQIEAQRSLAIAEARLRIAVEAAQLHIWHIEPSSRIRYFEDSIAPLLGLPASRPVDADEYLEAIAPHDRQKDLRALEDAMKPGGGVYRNIYRVNGKDGVQRTVLAMGRAVFEDTQKLLTFTGVIQDITEQVRQHAAAEGRALLAEQMIGIVGHDLRNPLSVVLSGADMLLHQPLSPSQEVVVGRIKRAGTRAHRLIADMLDFTMVRLGSGLTVVRKAVDIHNTVADCIDELSQAFSEAKFRHRQIGAGPCDVDPDRLFQLVGNLIANAVAYGEPGGEITLVSAVHKESFSVSVHNFGVPIAEELLTVLFEPMTRGAEAGGDVKSVGLGLFIVQEIARAHHGAIHVTSTPRDGTTFTFTAPRISEPAHGRLH